MRFDPLPGLRSRSNLKKTLASAFSRRIRSDVAKGFFYLCNWDINWAFLGPTLCLRVHIDGICCFLLVMDESEVSGAYCTIGYRPKGGKKQRYVHIISEIIFGLSHEPWPSQAWRPVYNGMKYSKEFKRCFVLATHELQDTTAWTKPQH
jgi:hypothetical protein